jgi:hypothetical protein
MVFARWGDACRRIERWRDFPAGCHEGMERPYCGRGGETGMRRRSRAEAVDRLHQGSMGALSGQVDVQAVELADDLCAGNMAFSRGHALKHAILADQCME